MIHCAALEWWRRDIKNKLVYCKFLGVIIRILIWKCSVHSHEYYLPPEHMWKNRFELIYLWREYGPIHIGNQHHSITYTTHNSSLPILGARMSGSATFSPAYLSTKHVHSVRYHSSLRGARPGGGRHSWWNASVHSLLVSNVTVMNVIASYITANSNVCSTFCSG